MTTEFLRDSVTFDGLRSASATVEGLRSASATVEGLRSASATVVNSSFGRDRLNLNPMKAQQPRTRVIPKIADRPIAAATPFVMGAIS